MHPIELRTIQDLIDRDHALGLYCTQCDRWALAPLVKLAARGHADTPFARLRFRCVRCGAPGRLQLRPPTLRDCVSAVGYFPALPSRTPMTDKRGSGSPPHHSLQAG